MQVFQLIGASIALVIVLVLVPRRVFPRLDGVMPLEQLAIDIVLSATAISVAALVFASVQLFQTMTFVLLSSLGVWIRWHHRGGTIRASLETLATKGRAMLYIFEAGSRDGNAEVKAAVRSWMRSIVRHMLPVAPSADRALRWMLISPLFAVVAVPTIISLLHPFSHAALFPASAYDTVGRMGELGIGRLFTGSFDAPGLAGVLAVADKLGPANATDLVRFGGPLLLVPALLFVYAIALRVTANPGIGFAAVGLAAIGTLRPELIPGIAPSGTVAASLAAPLVLAALLLAMGYASSAAGFRAWTMAAATLAVMLVDPSYAVVPVVASFALIFPAGVRRRGGWAAVRPLCLTLGAVVLGAMPYVVAASFEVDVAVSMPTFAPTFSVLSLIAVIGAVSILVRPMTSGAAIPPPLLPFAASVLAACVVGEAAFLLAVAPLLAVAVAVSAKRRSQVDAGWLVRSVSIGVALCVVMVVVFQPGAPPPAAASEHDSAAAALGRVLKGETDLTYSVIGPPTWTERVVGSAYRVDLAEFSRRLSLVDASDPGFALPVPSRRALVLSEKQAFSTSFGGHPYDEPTARKALMQRVERWLETYAKFHEGAEIVYEDDMIRVWSLDQPRDAALSERFGMAHE